MVFYVPVNQEENCSNYWNIESETPAAENFAPIQYVCNCKSNDAVEQKSEPYSSEGLQNADGGL